MAILTSTTTNNGTISIEGPDVVNGVSGPSRPALGVKPARKGKTGQREQVAAKAKPAKIKGESNPAPSFKAKGKPQPAGKSRRKHLSPPRRLLLPRLRSCSVSCGRRRVPPSPC